MVPPRKFPPFKNRILASLPKTELDRLLPHLTPVALPQQKTLLDGDLTHGYFLEDGIASVVVTVANGDTVEVGVIGIDGVVGFPIILGAGSMPGRTFVQVAASGYSIPAKDLKDAFERPGVLRRRVQSYMQAYLTQTAQTAVCNRLHNVEERLARWLLTCRDRISSDEIHLTQEFLGQMLGAPRTTVTLAAGLLERAGMITHARGTVVIKDREALTNAVCECYHTVRNEFQRLQLL